VYSCRVVDGTETEEGSRCARAEEWLARKISQANGQDLHQDLRLPNE
jgi:hypothetical protein